MRWHFPMIGFVKGHRLTHRSTRVSYRVLDSHAGTDYGYVEASIWVMLSSVNIQVLDSMQCRLSRLKPAFGKEFQVAHILPSLFACLGKSPRTSHFRSHDASMSWPVKERVTFVLMQATCSGCKSSVRHSTAIAYLGEISCGNLHSGFHLVRLGAYAPWRYVSSRLQMILTEKREVRLDFPVRMQRKIGEAFASLILVELLQGSPYAR